LYSAELLSKLESCLEPLSLEGHSLICATSRKGVADEQLAKAEMERGRKRARESEDSDQDVPKRRRSVSSASSVSVSTISTNLSRSPSPRPSIPQNARQKSRALRSESPPTRRASRISISPPRRLTDSEKKRRRDSFSSVESRSSEQPHRGAQDSEERYTRRKIQEHSPRARGRSPYRGNGRLSNDRRNSDEGRNFVRPTRKPSPPRERSLSPFSKRLALTQAMNMS